MRFSYVFLIINVLLVFYACHFRQPHDEVDDIITTWQNKEILFPKQVTLVSEFGCYNSYFVDTARFKILTYVDSLGCTTCKLQLPKWKNFLSSLDSAQLSASVLFFFNSSSVHEICHLLKRFDFNYFVYWDVKDNLNHLNHFPADFRFQTFLLDSHNRVLVIGNPIHNPLIKELYLQVMTGDTLSLCDSTIQNPKTFVSVPVTSVDFGNCRVKEIQITEFSLKNEGMFPLLIKDVSASCGCLTVNYQKEPLKTGKTLKIHVTISPESSGFFQKTISVYGNMENSPIVFQIKGTAYK